MNQKIGNDILENKLDLKIKEIEKMTSENQSLSDKLIRSYNENSKLEKTNQILQNELD